MEKQQVAAMIRKLAPVFGLLIIAALIIADPLNFRVSAEELSESRENLIKIARADGAEAAIAELEREMVRLRAGYDFCHHTLHLIGKEKGSAAVSFGDAVNFPDATLASCTGGYIHGAAEGFLEKSPSLLSDARKICGFFIDAGRAGWYLTCVHGAGHGVMAALGNNLPEALRICEEAFQGSDSRFEKACADGVYMANFDVGHHAGDGSASPYMKSDDLFYPCAGQPQKFKDRCYLHTAEHYLLHYPLDFEGALDFCGLAESAFRSRCFFNAGKRMVQNNTHNPKFAEALCERAPAGHLPDCIKGMADGFHEFFTPGRGRELCLEILTPANREFCPSVFKTAP